jgi:hypothetical protein
VIMEAYFSINLVSQVTLRSSGTDILNGCHLLRRLYNILYFLWPCKEFFIILYMFLKQKHAAFWEKKGMQSCHLSFVWTKSTSLVRNLNAYLFFGVHWYYWRSTFERTDTNFKLELQRTSRYRGWFTSRLAASISCCLSGCSIVCYAK